MTRLETLQELLAYLNKALKKSEDNLRKHRTGVWAPGPHFVELAEARVKNWFRWRDLVAELITEQALLNPPKQD